MLSHREKDALWQKTEGINTVMPSPAPQDSGLCARCRKDFRLLSRRYNCRWAMGGTGGDTGMALAWHGSHCLLSRQVMPA